MRYHHLSLKLFAASLLVAFVCLMPVAVAAQTQEQIRQQAMELFDANNFVAAVPLLEKSAITYPNDVAIASRLGFALYALGTTSKDPAVRKQHWERARKVLLQSRANGETCVEALDHEWSEKNQRRCHVPNCDRGEDEQSAGDQDFRPGRSRTRHSSSFRTPALGNTAT